MSREKQIEEMRNIMETDCGKPCAGCELETEEHCFTHNCAIRIYNAGYRKQNEGEWLVYGNANNRRAMCTNCRKEFAVQKGMLQLQYFPNCPLCGSRMRNAKMKGGTE